VPLAISAIGSPISLNALAVSRAFLRSPSASPLALPSARPLALPSARPLALPSARPLA